MQALAVPAKVIIFIFFIYFFLSLLYFQHPNYVKLFVSRLIASLSYFRAFLLFKVILPIYLSIIFTVILGRFLI